MLLECVDCPVCVLLQEEGDDLSSEQRSAPGQGELVWVCWFHFLLSPINRKQWRPS